MTRHPTSSSSGVLHSGALGIACGYLILGNLWILFSDQLAARVATSEEMLASISLYKGWGYVLVTALLLYWLIRRYAAAMRASELQLHRVIDAMPVFISYVGTDRRYRFTNKTYQEWYEENTEGKHIQEVLGKPAYQAISKYVDQVLAGQPVSYESEISVRDTELLMDVRYIPDSEANGHVRGFFVLAQDKTAQRQAEEEQRLWADAFEGCAHGIVVDDPNTNRILACNPAFARMHKVSVEDIVGSPILSLYAPSDHEQVRHHVQKADQIGHARFEASMIRRGKDRSSFPVQVDIVSVLGDNGELLHRVVTAQDITDRKQAEQILQESEERYRMVSELTSDYAYKDRVEEDGSIIPEWFTESFTRITGYTLEEAGAPGFWQQLVYPEDINLLVEHMHKILSGQPHTTEVRITTKSSELRWLRDYSNPIWDTDQKRVVGLYGAVQDITAYKQTQEKLLLQAHWLEQINDAVIALDKNLLITAWNRAAERIYGWKAEEVIGKRSEDVLKTEFFSTSRAEALEQLQAIGEFSAEITQARKDESRIHIEARTAAMYDETGQIIGYVSANRDISERKQIEKALQAAHDELEQKVQERTAALSEANALLQALMDNIPDHIYFKDTQSQFIRNSRSQATLLGLRDPAEAVGKTDFDFFPHAAKSFAEEQEVMQSGIPLVDFEEWVVWPDGREMWVSTTKMPLRNSDGQTIGIFGISRDITERKRNEQAIRQLNADLEKQAEQLQAANKELEAFSYSVSHDLRAPLRAIDGYTRILVEDYESVLDSEGKRICSVISREARRMGQLIDDLLAFSRLGRREIYFSRIDMETLANSVFVELTKDENRERVGFVIENLPVAHGDSSLIRQVWVNLLSNAIKFTSRKERAVIEVGSQQSNDENIYFVRDNGAGFDMEYSNKLFGVFQRLHSENEFSGTGVGLAIVQRIIRRHGGRVWAEGEVEKGATFYFALPRKENPS
ncbi:MAG TPA: PAS domain S-box protein [Anaerolineales bacterium]|nr:PAS domain S-box protein [Anaerolineales bacterium]